MGIRIAKTIGFEAQKCDPNSRSLRLGEIASVLDSVFQDSNLVTGMAMNSHILPSRVAYPRMKYAGNERWYFS